MINGSNDNLTLKSKVCVALYYFRSTVNAKIAGFRATNITYNVLG